MILIDKIPVFVQAFKIKISVATTKKSGILLNPW